MDHDDVAVALFLLLEFVGGFFVALELGGNSGLCDDENIGTL